MTTQLTRHLTLPMSAVSGVFLIREGSSIRIDFLAIVRERIHKLGICLSTART